MVAATSTVMITSVPRTTRRMIPLVVVLLLLHTDSSECFATSRSTSGRSAIPKVSIQSRLSTYVRPKSGTQVNLFRNDPDLVTKLTSPLAAGGLALPLMLAFTASLFGSASASAATADGAIATGLTSLLSSPLIEAEVLNDMAHLTLDLASFFGPVSLAIRAAAVLGRIAAMGADYMPDHSMCPEELVYQFFMLSLAWMALVKSAMPVVLSVMASNITLRDGKAFSLLFGPAGMTWPQYKALSVTALDWVKVEPGEIVTSDELSSPDSVDEYIYWLYAGETVVESQGKILHNVKRAVRGSITSLKEDAGRGLLGEMRLLRHMQAKERGGPFSKRKAKNHNKDKEQHEDTTSTTTKSYPRTTVKAGDTGATLLRIHTSNLVMLMDHDVELAHAVRSLLFQGMHDKLAARLHIPNNATCRPPHTSLEIDTVHRCR
jgi:hypothetical protein